MYLGWGMSAAEMGRKMKRQYTIHEVADLLGISSDAIRLYEKEGLIRAHRNEKNGYRYYETEQIHRIMGISLYRQLGVGLSEISKLFQLSTFPGVAGEFQNLIESSEHQIEKLQQKIEKMRFMKAHLEMLNQGIGTYSVRQLPSRYVIFQNETGAIRYEEIKRVINQDFFSFGNFGYTIEKAEQGDYVTRSLSFTIRESMYALCPIQPEGMEHLEECNCLYTVCSNGELEHPKWKLKELYEYGARNGYHLSEEAYAFYVYSLISDSGIVDFYEIYVPIL